MREVVKKEGRLCGAMVSKPQLVEVPWILVQVGLKPDWVQLELPVIHPAFDLGGFVLLELQ